MSEPYYGWAVDAVEGLRWLVDLDDWAFSGTRENLASRDPKVIDMVHVRWATSTSVTALDLCGVELAVRYGGLDFWTKQAPVLDRVEAEVKKADRRLPQWGHEWLATVLRDPRYKTLKKTRAPLDPSVSGQVRIALDYRPDRASIAHRIGCAQSRATRKSAFREAADPARSRRG
jgi:hypothetical protein